MKLNAFFFSEFIRFIVYSCNDFTQTDNIYRKKREIPIWISWILSEVFCYFIILLFAHGGTWYRTDGVSVNEK